MNYLRVKVLVFPLYSSSYRAMQQFLRSSPVPSLHATQRKDTDNEQVVLGENSLSILFADS
jgi:hypothetical protein